MGKTYKLIITDTETNEVVANEEFNCIFCALNRVESNAIAAFGYTDTNAFNTITTAKAAQNKAEEYINKFMSAISGEQSNNELYQMLEDLVLKENNDEEGNNGI